MPKVAAHEINKALANRHQEDFFMTEVKNGPSHGTNMFRMDAVAIKKSWANPCITCYEVKVNRQDFLRDEKWPVYMGYSNRFAFACPEGLIQKEELPNEVGLLWYKGDGKPFKIVRQPIYRPVVIPNDFYMYIIMSKLDSDRYPFFTYKQAFFKEWFEGKKADKDFGYDVSQKLSERSHELDREISKLKREKEYSEDYKSEIETVIKIMQEHGLKTDHWRSGWIDDLKKYLDAGTKCNPFQLNKAIEHTQGALSYLEMMKGEIIQNAK